MARRRIGQDMLAFSPENAGRQSALDKLLDLIDWTPVEHHLRDISCAAKGEPAWPPLVLFKALLIAVWHDLSDVRLAEALADRASFRRFCGFAACEPTPERTSFVRFRRELVARGLDRLLFEAVTSQLKAKAVTVKTGTLIDATITPRLATVTAKRPGRVTSGARQSMASRHMSAPMPTPPSSRTSR
jgi:transposase, IS5 family